MTRLHGTQGEVRIVAFNPEAPNLRAGRQVTVGDQSLQIRSIRPVNHGFLVMFQGVTAREDAEALQGLLIEVPEWTVRPDDGAYFVHQLIGLDVFLPDGSRLGEVIDLLQPGANDVYVVAGPGGEVLIPAIAEVITEIDLANRRMVITPLPGLLNDSL